MTRKHQARSWFAYLSAGLGLLSIVGVLCFHFPELLTSRDFRQVYSEAFARQLLLAGIVAAFTLGCLAILHGRNQRVAMLGVASATAAVLLGGSRVEFDPIRPTAYSLGLDWFAVSLFFSALVFVPIERMLGREQSPLRPEWRTDLAWFFMSHLLVQFILLVVTTSTSQLDALVASDAIKQEIRALPTWLQFLLAVLFADLFQSLLHRAYHRIPWLWRFHAIHHSSRHMDWLAGSRMHLVEVLMTRCAVLLPLVVLGFSTAALNAYVLLVGLQAVLAHANLRTRFGWLENILVLPRYHHWHHARDRDYVDANYAIHLPVVDMIMGTHRMPPDDRWPDQYGVLKAESVPNDFLRQQVSPFMPWRKQWPDVADRAERA